METILTTILTPTIRHGMTAAAGALVTAGIIEAGQTGSFVTVGTGVAVGAAGWLWSIIKNRIDKKKIAIATGRSDK